MPPAFYKNNLWLRDESRKPFDRKGSQPMKRRIYAAALLLAMVLSMAGCAASQDQPTEGKVGDDQVVPVEVMNAERGDLTLQRQKGARLTAAREAMVIPAMPGEVTEVLVTVGEHVEADQVLVRLDDTAVQSQIDQAQAAYNAAKANVDLSRQSLADLQQQKADAQADLDEYRDDVDKDKLQDELKKVNKQISQLNQSYAASGGSPPVTDAYYEANMKELVNARDQLTAAISQDAMLEQAVDGIDNAIKGLPFNESTLNAQLNQAGVAVSAAKDALDALELKAPAAGTVSSVSVSAGDFATQSMPPVTIVDTETLILQVPLTEYEVTRVSAGQQIALSVDALSREYAGIVEWVSPAMEQRTQSYYARVRVDNADGRLRPGMYARADIVVDQAENAVLLPKEALVREDDVTYVYMIDEGAARRVAVSLGLDDGYTVEVLSGIHAGDSVVIKGQAYLNDGIAIEIVEDAAS